MSEWHDFMRVLLNDRKSILYQSSVTLDEISDELNNERLGYPGGELMKRWLIRHGFSQNSDWSWTKMDDIKRS